MLLVIHSNKSNTVASRFFEYSLFKNARFFEPKVTSFPPLYPKLILPSISGTTWIFQKPILVFLGGLKYRDSTKELTSLGQRPKYRVQKVEGHKRCSILSHGAKMAKRGKSTKPFLLSRN